ncbi:hypothetical protein CBR_g17900 [Chara braunii]|uniref:Uncharacterized protein n=1 Tax=Chara braunii TaxID=69332 RepID=A0A388KW05_CHABU|nr:hypothetical protein CBR_g17900 [Chara braunii]|eukprot:GBG74188.1 hypothetical protein CBR_g17900 [Chara braunii]
MGLSPPGTEALVEFCRLDESRKEWTDELRRILEVTASTGNVWHDWEFLKKLLAFRLDQVLSDYNKKRYPSGGGEGPPRPLSTGESFEELRGRLHHSLSEFIDGPPFTIQRLSEVLLDPTSTYPTLEKVALAIEKLLSVTSTIQVSRHPFPLSPPSSLPTARGVCEGEICPPPPLPSSATDGFSEAADGAAVPPPTMIAVSQGLPRQQQHQPGQPSLLMSASTEANLVNAVLMSSSSSPPSSSSAEAEISEAMVLTSSLHASRSEEGNCVATPPSPPVVAAVVEGSRSSDDSPSDDQIMASLLETSPNDVMQVVGESGDLPTTPGASVSPVVDNMLSSDHNPSDDKARRRTPRTDTAADIDGVAPMEADTNLGTGGREDHPPSPLPPPTAPPASPQGEDTKEEDLRPACDGREDKAELMGSGNDATGAREHNISNTLSEEEEAQFLREAPSNMAGKDLVDCAVENVLKADRPGDGNDDQNHDVDMVDAADS